MSDPGQDALTKPLSDLDAGALHKHVLTDSVDHIACLVAFAYKGIEVQVTTSHQCSHIGATRSPDDDFCRIRIPSASQFDRHQRCGLKCGAGDSPATQY